MDSGSVGPLVGSRLASVLVALNPDEFALRDRVAAQLDDSMLDEIAAADYGVDVDQHRRDVGDLLTGRWWPDRLDWHPGEVLALVRSSRVEDVSAATALNVRRFHLMRAFACLVLVRVGASNGEPSSSLGPLVVSSLELGEPIVDDALRFLAWCRLHEPGEWRVEPAERPFLTFSLLVLATATDAEPEALGVLAASLLAELASTLADEGEPWRIDVGAPLLGLKPRAMRHRMWYDVAGRCLVDQATETDVGRRLARLGRAIRGETEESISDVRPLFAAWEG